MAFLTMEDLTGEYDVVVFPNQFDQYRHILEKDNLLIIKGRPSNRNEDEPASILSSNIYDLENKREKIPVCRKKTSQSKPAQKPKSEKKSRNAGKAAGKP